MNTIFLIVQYTPKTVEMNCSHNNLSYNFAFCKLVIQLYEFMNMTFPNNITQMLQQDYNSL